MKKITLLATILAFTFIACDKIDNPIPEDIGSSVSFEGGVEIIPEPSLGLTDSTGLADSASIQAFIDTNVWTTVQGADNSNRRFITLEEFTGHRCTSCPNGTREISRLQNEFNEQLIPVGIHTGTFAEPVTTGSPIYATDFRVGGKDDIAARYASEFGVAGNPRGIVSRIGTAEAETKWQTSIRAIFADVPAAKLALTTHYDSINDVIRAQADIEWYESSSNNYNLQFYVIEGKIIDFQLDNGVIISNYEHKFVLRKIVNGLFGKQLKTAEIGKIEKIQYIFKNDSKWKAKNIEIVAFIFNNDPNAYEVIQANSAFVK